MSMMPLMPLLSRLAQKDPTARRLALEAALNEAGLAYELQENDAPEDSLEKLRNYLLRPWHTAQGAPSAPYLFCAHYDAVPGSLGANDNAAALCILIALAQALKAESYPAGFIFFDGEERKNAGSRYFAAALKPGQYQAVINLDICGYGDTIAIYGRGYERRPVLRRFCHREVMARHQAQLVKYLPPGDDRSFKGSKLPVLSLAVMPRWDIQFLKALAGFGEGLLGRPPEFDMIMGQMEVSSTMHGGYRDKPEWIEEKSMRLLYDFLWNALHHEAPPRRLFHR